MRETDGGESEKKKGGSSAQIAEHRKRKKEKDIKRGNVKDLMVGKGELSSSY